MNIVKYNRNLPGKFARFAKRAAAASAASMVAVGSALAQATDLAGEATTKLTAAGTSINGIFLVLIGIVMAFVVYMLIKKAANKT